MNRYARRVDANQEEIIRALRQSGATVQPLHMVGDGCPDLAVGLRGLNFFLEVKDGAKPPSARQLTRDERAWHEGWRGSVVVVSSVDEALRAVGAI